MKYTLKVELEVEIDFLDTDELDLDTQEDINDLVVEVLSDHGYELTKKIFEETNQHTRVTIDNGFTYDEKIKSDSWNDEDDLD